MSDLKISPPPWVLKATAYAFGFWVPKKETQEKGLPNHIAYSPLEGSSSYANDENSKPLGGLAMVELFRYTESPVGPYDEIILTPGFHEYTVEGKDGKRIKKKNTRVTRIYVSQKHTCWNGRKNWNIPKHLAQFEWTTNPDGSETVRVFPHDTNADATEATASTIPFFTATIKPVPYVPAFPMSLKPLKYLGLDVTLVGPPLPQGNGSQGELPGTDRWCAIHPGISTPRAMLASFDMKQPDHGLDPEEAKVKGLSTEENFWPGLGRWQYGVKMENATVDFPEAVYWDAPKSQL